MLINRLINLEDVLSVVEVDGRIKLRALNAVENSEGNGHGGRIGNYVLMISQYIRTP